MLKPLNPFLPSRAERGVVLFEVMIAIVILAVGLLGLAKLQASTRQLEMESYQRAQAVILLQDMVGRLSSNNKAAACYAITDSASGAPYFGYGAAAPAACGVGTIAQQATALSDMTQWHELLSGASETASAIDGGAQVGAMIGARGCVSLIDAVANVYEVTVAWQGLLESSAPAGLNCATGLYGSEPRRRAVSATVRIATLS
jgi:type IV pilus assembly protein PilV